MGYTTHTPVGGMSNMRWYTDFKIKNYLSTALDRMAEVAVAQERERVREWVEKNRFAQSINDEGHPEDWIILEDELLAFLSANKK